MSMLRRGLVLVLLVHHRAVGRERDRGDVPGWVFVTVMTAALVGALYLLVGPRLQELLTEAMTDILGDD